MLDTNEVEAVSDGLNERKSLHLQRQVQEYRDQIDSRTAQIESRRRAITTELQQMAETRDLLRISMEAADDRTYVDHLLEEWADLSIHPRLDSASMEDGIITLQTTDDIRLHREDSDETRWLGRFKLVLNLDSGGITINNLDTRRGGRDHPHVVNGNPCFGSDHGIFSELMAAGSLNLLYEMLLQYLEKLNLRDEYGAYGSYWFEQDDVRPEGAPRPEPEPQPMSVLEFAEQYGVGVEFSAVHGPSATDRAGRRGVVDGMNDDRAEVRWLDDDDVETRGGGLRVIRAVTLDEIVEAIA